METKRLNILILEDELLIAEMLKEMLLELGYCVAGQAKSYHEALVQLQQKPAINFAILDINLGQPQTGLDVAKVIQGQYSIPFIFLTSYSDKKTLHEAIQYKPEAYLIKPFTKPDLLATIEIIRSRKSSDSFYIFKDGHLTIKLGLDEILWLKSENVYVEIKTTAKQYLVRSSLEKVLNEINHQTFFRVHRSYAVNVNYVKAMNGQYLLVADQKIPLSRKYYHEFMSRFS